MVDDFRRLLSQRAADPWFDVAWCRDDGSVDLPALSALFFNTLPCDVIQQGWGSDDKPRRDVLVTFKSDGIAQNDGSVAPTAANSGLRAVQAQFDYLLAHLSPSKGILATTRPSPRPCPFYTCCTLEMRRTDPDTCWQAPWAHFTAPGDTCWYGIAVGATLGTVRNR